MRRVPKSGGITRLLAWDGEQIKADAAVTAAMREILQADKEAISALVCLRQGELDKLFTGNEGTRRDLFMTLVMVGHLEKARKQVGNFKKNLITGLVDLGGLRDQAVEMLEFQEGQVEEAAEALASTDDMSRIITFLRELEDLLGDRMKLQFEAEKSQGELDAVPAEELIQHTAEIDRLDRLCTDISAARVTIGRLDDSITRARDYQKAGALVASAAKSLESCITEEQSRDISRKQTTYAAAATDRTKHSERKTAALADIDSSKTVVQSKGDLLPRLQEAAQTCVEAYETRREAYATAQGEAQAQEKTVKLLEVALECGQGDNCPICDQSLAGADNLAGTLQHAREVFTTMRATLEREMGLGKTSATARNTAQAAATDCTEKLARAKITLAHAQEVFAEANEALNALSSCVEPTPEELAACDSHTSAVSTLASARAVLASQESNMIHAVRLSTTIKEKADAELFISNNQTTSQLGEILAKLRGEEKASAEKRGRRAELVARMDYLGERVRNNDAAIDENMLLPLCDEVYPETETDEPISVTLVTRDLASAELKQERFTALSASLKTAQETKREASGRVADIAEREERQKAQQELVDELSRLQDAFAPTGIPTTYLNYLFDHVAWSTQNYLSDMHADFVVSPSPHSALAFQFTRTSDPSGSVMHQSKLSGAQKVRLSIAVILAVHDLLIPGVGLLLLDEPSSHMDADSAADLAELLTHLGQIGQSTGRQILVIDHDPILETAMDSVSRLTGEFAGQAEA